MKRRWKIRWRNRPSSMDIRRRKWQQDLLSSAKRNDFVSIISVQDIGQLKAVKHLRNTFWLKFIEVPIIWHLQCGASLKGAKNDFSMAIALTLISRTV